MTNIVPRRVAVFLGAGASIQFGVPNAKGLLTGYLHSRAAAGKKASCVNQLIREMKACSVEITLENLLMLIDAYAKPDEVIARIRPFLPLVKARKKIKLVAKPECGEIAKDIRDYVFRKCFINDVNNIEKSAIFYDRVFRGLKTYFSVRSLRPSDHGYPYPDVQVFTTNFDNSIEHFCRKQKVRLTDGYSRAPVGGYKFNNEEYNQAINPNFLRLYKIHGTVKYMKTPSGEFEEVSYLYPRKPIIINGAECFPDLIFSESYQYTSNSPQLELLYSLKQGLQASDRIVIIGYSFPDPHILTIFKDALAENVASCLVLFSRNPNLIIEKKLGFMSDRCIGIPKDAKSIDPVDDFKKMGVPP